MPPLDLGPIVDRLWLRYRDQLWQHVRPFLVNVITEVMADPHAWSGSAERELSPEDHELAAAWACRHQRKQKQAKTTKANPTKAHARRERSGMRSTAEAQTKEA